MPVARGFRFASPQLPPSSNSISGGAEEGTASAFFGQAAPPNQGSSSSAADVFGGSAPSFGGPAPPLMAQGELLQPSTPLAGYHQPERHQQQDEYPATPDSANQGPPMYYVSAEPLPEVKTDVVVEKEVSGPPAEASGSNECNNPVVGSTVEPHVADAMISYLLHRVKDLKVQVNDLQTTQPVITPEQGRTAASSSSSNLSEVDRRVLEASREVADARMHKRDMDMQHSKLLKCLRSDKIGMARKELDADPRALTARSTDTGFTLLHHVAKWGCVNICRMLLSEPQYSKAIDVFKTDMIGRTALHVAAEHLHADVCTEIMQSMGSPVGENAPKDMAGLTPAACSALKRVRNGAKGAEDSANKSACRVLLHRRGDSCISPFKRPSATKTPGRSALRRQISVAPEFCSGVHCLPGYRVIMEDYAITFSPPKRPAESRVVCAVFDGHGGSGASEYCFDNIRSVFASVEQPGDAANTIRSTCAALEDGLAALPEFQIREIEIRKAIGDEPRKVKRMATDNSGTTLVMAVVTEKEVAVGNVGDSRALMVYHAAAGQMPPGSASFKTMSRDHSLAPTNETSNVIFPEETFEGLTMQQFKDAEKGRILAAGGSVDEKGYVSLDESHKIHMTRTVGNFAGKQRSDLPRESQIVTAVPEVHIVERSNETSGAVLVLASDGVWDVLSNEACADYVRGACAGALSGGAAGGLTSEILEDVAEKLALHCLDIGSMDNISVAIVSLDLQGNAVKSARRAPTASFPFSSPLPPAHPPNSTRKRLALDV